MVKRIHSSHCPLFKNRNSPLQDMQTVFLHFPLPTGAPFHDLATTTAWSNCHIHKHRQWERLPGKRLTGPVKSLSLLPGLRPPRLCLRLIIIYLFFNGLHQVAEQKQLEAKEEVLLRWKGATAASCTCSGDLEEAVGRKANVCECWCDIL